MQTSGITPRLLMAYVHADMVGFSRLVGQNDADTFARLTELRQGLIDPALRRYGGRIANTAGDSLMMVFTSVISAVRFAVEIQTRMPEFDRGVPSDRRIRFRMGVHIGDAIADDENLFGDSVNIAARLQAICPPGDVCVSDVVRQHVKELDPKFRPVGKVQFKNIPHPVEAFVVQLDAHVVRRRHLKSIVATVLVVIMAIGSVTYLILHGNGVKQVVDAGALSIAVLPFTNLGNDRNDDYLGDGIADDLTTDLSQLDGAVVVARESAFSYRGKEVDIRDVGKQLGVRYVLEGSVRKLSDTLRINAQLILADPGTSVWADRFDQPMRDLRGGQDMIVQRIGTAVNRKFEKRQQGGPTTDPNAYNLILRAKATLQEPRSDARNIIAAGYFEQALRLDPSSVQAEAGVASMIIETNRSLSRAATLIDRASLVAPESPDVLGAKFRLLLSRRQVQEALSTYSQLLDIDSSAAGLAAAFIQCAPCLSRLVRPEDLYPLMERTVRLNPLSPDRAVMNLLLGRTAILLGRDQDAVNWLQHAMHFYQQLTPTELNARDSNDFSFENTKLDLAAAYALTGQISDAHQMLWSALTSAQTMDITVRYLINTIPVYFDAHRREQELRIVQGLRLAGLREHLDERAEFHANPNMLLQSNNNGPTPTSVPGAVTIYTEDMVELLKSKPVILTTSNQNPTIPGAILIAIPNAGSLTDEWQHALQVIMDRINNGDMQRPIVTFAWSVNRWHARNLTLRLIALGYKHVYWYRGGWEAWDAHNLPMAPLAVQYLPPQQ
jgi:adenylate cyclase